MEDIYIKFNTISEFRDYFDKGKPCGKHKEIYNQDSQDVASWGDWYGTKTYQEAQNLITYGDKDIADSIYEGVGRLCKGLKTKVRQLSAAVCGHAPHVPNYIAGRPNAMIRANYIPVKTKIINLVNGGISAQEMKQAAVTILSAIKTIESRGVRINLYVADISYWRLREGVQFIGWTLKIKSSSQHLDILKTAYPLCNPAMLRRHSFRFTEVTKKVRGSGYGCASYDVTELCKSTGVNRAVQISFDTASSYGVDELVQYILKQVEKIK